MCQDCNCACAKPTPTIDWTKPVRMKGNHSARVEIIYTSAEGRYPVVAVVDGRVERYTLDGFYCLSGNDWPENLENIPEKRRAWVNIYPYPYTTKASADRFAHSDRIACVEVEFTEGEGL